MKGAGVFESSCGSLRLCKGSCSVLGLKFMWELVSLRLKVCVGAGGYVNKPKIGYSSGPGLWPSWPSTDPHLTFTWPSPDLDLSLTIKQIDDNHKTHSRIILTFSLDLSQKCWNKTSVTFTAAINQNPPTETIHNKIIWSKVLIDSQKLVHKFHWASSVPGRRPSSVLKCQAQTKEKQIIL